MKGLLLKDLLGLKRYLRTFIVLLLFYIVFAFSTDSAGFLIGMSALLAAMLPMAAFAYDETAKWDNFGLTLPVRRQDVVRSRYLLALLFLLLGMVLSVILAMALDLVKGRAIQLETLTACYIAIGFTFLIDAVMLPLFYRFGPEKARFMMIGVMLVVGLASFLAARMGIVSWVDTLGEEATTQALYFLPLVGLLIYIGSYFVSCGIYTKKEF